MNRALFLLPLSVITFNTSAAVAQESSRNPFLTPQSTQSADQTGAASTSGSSAAVGVSRFAPPDVPPRPPLPAGSASSDGITAGATPAPVKESLAWRVKAHKLRTTANAKQRTLSTNYDAAIMSLISALSSSGLRVQTLNSRAGELLAAPADAFNKQRLIFVVAEMPPGTVTIKALPMQINKEGNALIDSVFASLGNAPTVDNQRGEQ